MPRVEERVTELERQVTMLERMIQMLGDTLDRRFDRYEQAIESQSHKIAELTILMLSMVSEQHKWSGSLKDRISQIAPKNDVFYELFEGGNDAGTATGVNDNQTDPGAATASSYGFPLPPPHTAVDTVAAAATAAPAVSSSSSSTSEAQQHPQRSKIQRPNVFTGKFQFLKSPHSVKEVWKEYVEGINGQPSIREMEHLYQTGWRRDPAVNKRYARRKVLWKAIENGLGRGYSLEYIINLLEEYRYIDRGKGIKHPIGWICQNHNIPEILR
ncbi:hypothetical protein ZYGM_001616 [Zygosaccharomyces mellis]|uniref:Transcription activator GCR1-like domain-containing protein n=1 Tax=Zygosaccharomyces mellis TaxID=42258 RepID=A0A4C2EAU2_9SACH|nr:hypothetical protein ZYGM_001616 [Zygosaccharomyces mellis]